MLQGGGFNYTSEQLDQIFDKCKPIVGKKNYGRDVSGNVIYRYSYGKRGDMSWEVDHIIPLAHNGQHCLSNWQPLYHEQNNDKGDTLNYDYLKNPLGMSLQKFLSR